MAVPLSAEARSERARMGAHAQWRRETDRTARTQKARDAHEKRYIEKAKELHPTVTDEELLKKIAKNIKGEELARARFEASKRRGRGK